MSPESKFSCASKFERQTLRHSVQVFGVETREFSRIPQALTLFYDPGFGMRHFTYEEIRESYGA